VRLPNKRFAVKVHETSDPIPLQSEALVAVKVIWFSVRIFWDLSFCASVIGGTTGGGPIRSLLFSCNSVEVVGPHACCAIA